MNALFYLLFCLVADVLVACGDFLSKKWVLGQGLKFFFGAYFLYILSIGGWFGLIKLNTDVGRSNIIWATGGMVVSMLIGYFVFGEILTTLNKFGVGLCLTGVIMCAIR